LIQQCAMTKCVLRYQQKIPHNLFGPSATNWPIIWDIFEKSPHHISIVHDDDGEGGGETPYFLCAIVQLLSQKALG
jgi:hypothetical protein